jgi:hypothetical protein
LSAGFTWESFRRPDGTLDLHGALMARTPQFPNPQLVRRAWDFLDEVEADMRLRNAEAAAITLAFALRIVRGEL